MFLKASTNSANLQQLFFTLQAGFKRTSPAQKLKQRNKYCASRPEKFKLVGKIQRFDFQDKNLKFPLNLPLKLKYVYIPQTHKPNLPTHDFINFKTMSGNEILLNLENYASLRPTEICSALIELSKRDGSKDIDWNTHEWIIGTTQQCIKMLPTYTPSVVGYLVVAFQRLKITDAELWRKLTIELQKTLHKFNAKSFGYTYVAYLEDTNRSSEEFRKQLVDLLPVHLRGMTPSMMTDCFQLTFDRGYLSEYLFEQHYHVLYWRRNIWFGADNLLKVLRIYPKLNFVDDCNFFEGAIIPNIPKLKNQLNEHNTKEMMTVLQELEVKYPEIKIASTLKFLNNHLTFCTTKLKAIENAKFYNVVLNDFAYYKIKESQRLQKAQAAQQ